MTTTRRIRAVLGLKKTKILVLLTQAKSIHDGMQAHPALFPTPNPPAAILLSQIQSLETAQQATTTNARGLVAVRNAARDVVCTSLESERMYVQSLCDQHPEHAMEYITAAGMTAGDVPSRDKPILEVKRGKKPGSVLLFANAKLLVGKRPSRKVTFNWQSRAAGGTTWVDAKSTPLSDTEIEGLVVMTTYEFRVSVTISKTTGEWSQAMEFLVR